jgi:hypothetical protein
LDDIEVNGFLSRLAGNAVAGLGGGAILYGVETVDRLWTLWPSFASGGEAALYALYLAPDLLLGLAAGLALGLLLAVGGSIREAAARHAIAATPMRANLLGALVAVAFLTAVATIASTLAHTAVVDPLYRVVQKVDGRLVRIPALVQNFSIYLTVGFALAAAGLVALDWAATARLGRRRWLAIVPAGAALAVLLGLYAIDSRLFFGRYEQTMHVPALAAQLVAATIAAVFCFVAVASRPSSRRALAVAIAITGLATVAFGVDIWHLGANENLNALLWRRSVAARRAYQVVGLLTDRDRDGFSSLFDGDLDDGDPRVNPMATEIPGNGVDDNCIGGDGEGTAATVPVRLDSTPAVAPPGAAKNLVLISIDTLRADRMSAYGYARPTSPRLEEWGARGLFFERAYSQGTNTGNSFASMNRSATRARLFDMEEPTLFTRLSDAGYRTTFINARRDDVWLETKRWVKYRRVILNGIQAIDHTEGEQLWDGDAVTDRAIAFLSSIPAGEPSATWVHYLDPHEPRKKMAPFDFGNSASDKYDTEVAFADREVGRLLDWLRSSGRLDDSIVVLVADHGESFHDHGMDLHGNRPYGEQIHVPFMIWANDLAPSRVSTPVALLDVAPTLLAYLGLEPLPSAEGHDLRTGTPDRPIYSETPLNLVEVSFFANAVTDGRWRYIWDVRGNTVELYDLDADPDELHNLANSNPSKAAELRARLAAWLDSTRAVRSLRDA